MGMEIGEEGVEKEGEELEKGWGGGGGKRDRMVMKEWDRGLEKIVEVGGEDGLGWGSGEEQDEEVVGS